MVYFVLKINEFLYQYFKINNEVHFGIIFKSNYERNRRFASV